MEQHIENFKKIDTENDVYTSLKEGLLNGSISLIGVRDTLIKLDQSTPSRDASFKNLSFLNDPQIIGYVHQHPEIQEGYHSFLSFTEFHVAQRFAMNDKNESIEHFKKALENARNENWEAYIKGTILYMEGKEIPETIILKLGQSRNAEILKNLNNGLKKRGLPSYKEDYYPVITSSHTNYN